MLDSWCFSLMFVIFWCAGYLAGASVPGGKVCHSCDSIMCALYSLYQAGKMALHAPAD